MDERSELTGQVAIVTGASSGLGSHFARTLAVAGAKVALAARRLDRTEALAAEIEAADGRALPVALDVTDAGTIAAAIDVAETELGPLSILVNNAGIAASQPLEETEPADWDRVIDTNLRGAFLMAREAAGHMIRLGRPGRIVNIASALADTAAARMHAYAASKAGLVQLTRTLAVELAPHAILVNAISPGYIKTDLNRAFLDGPGGEKVVRRTPLRRLGMAADLDGALMLLAGPGGAFMTGSVITVDGGLTLSAL